jgi:IMP dehydrogenase
MGSSTHKANHIEGVSAFTNCKGNFKDVLAKLLEGVRSGMSYQGSADLFDLKEDPQFIRITNAGLRESLPHDVKL